MPSNRSDNRQSQQKQPTGPRKHELSPLTYTPGMGRRDTEWEDEEDEFAEDDPMVSPPRSTSSAIRINNPASMRRSGRDINPETTRQNIPVPPRRSGQPRAPLPGPMQARPVRNTTVQPTMQPPPKQGGRNIHWLLYVGVGMIAALALWVVGSSFLAWATTKYNDITYGNPRTYQVDAAVGHGDSPTQPSHFIALNLHGQVIVVEFMGGNPAKSINYTGPDLFEAGGNQIPITLEFRDVTGDGKPDMLIHIQDKVFVFVNDGTKFRPANSNDKIHL